MPWIKVRKKYKETFVEKIGYFQKASYKIIYNSKLRYKNENAFDYMSKWKYKILNATVIYIAIHKYVEFLSCIYQSFKK